MCREISRELEKLAPDDVDAKIRLATFFVLGNRLDDAQVRLDKVLKNDPDHIEGLYLQAAVFAKEKTDIEKIEEIYQTIIKTDIKQPKAFLAIANIMASKKNLDEAKQQLEIGIQNNPGSVDLSKALYQIHLRQNDPESAKETLQELSRAHPDDPDPFILEPHRFESL